MVNHGIVSNVALWNWVTVNLINFILIVWWWYRYCEVPAGVMIVALGMP